MSVHIQTRRCTMDQQGGSDELFANKLKNYIPTCPQPVGYCNMTNPTYPIKNHKNCRDGNQWSKNYIGWIWNFTFIEEEHDTYYEIEFGTDFGRGSAIFVDGVYQAGFQRDFWWAGNWNNPGVFRMNYNFTQGKHEVMVYGLEFCCDGDMIVRYSRNEQPKKPLTPDNWNCEHTNTCDTTCQAGQYKKGHLCKDCNYRCGECDDCAINCQTCGGSNRLAAPDCLCKDGYYDVEGKAHCQRCHTSCKTCNSADTCNSCNDGWYKDGNVCLKCTDLWGSYCGKCNKNTCQKCNNNPSYLMPDCTKTTCDANQYKVGKFCHDCNAGCKTCIDNQACTSCQDDEYLHQGVCSKCTDKYGPLCGTCNCQVCLTCKNDPSFFLPDCTTNNCGAGKMLDGNVCRDCEAKCVTCTNPTTCTECIDGYYLDNGDCYQCIADCSTCTAINTCQTCSKPNFTPASTCSECTVGYFLTDSNQCACCTTYYGDNCAECDADGCKSCSNNPHFTVPRCEDNKCLDREYMDGLECKPCQDHCLECSDGYSCEKCIETMYPDGDGQCVPCEYPCLMCSSQTDCDLCADLGFQPPTCISCDERFFAYGSDCVRQCPEHMYGDVSDNTCKSCSDSCFDCEYNKYFCTICPNEKILHEGRCVDCEDIYGMEQVPDAPKGVCQEICGDGILLENSIHECDDGNNFSDDGCSADCKQENGWLCDVEYDGDNLEEDCKDKRPIGFSVTFNMDDQYLNVDEQAPINCEMDFNKSFELPPGTNISDYIVVTIEGKNVDSIGVEVTLKNSGRLLANGQPEPPKYDLKLQPKDTMKKRNMAIDLYPKSAFDDGSGNTLADEPPPQQEIKEYYYYTEGERYGTNRFEYWMKLGMMLLMFLMPFYVFLYKNHFNRFYVLFFVIDATQTLYFYRFLNIRWPINGIKFYKLLRPAIGFYMWNFYEREIPDDEFEKYSSGVEKFDTEKESALFMNNTGHILTLLYLYLFLYMLIIVLTQKKLYCGNEKNIIYRLLWQFRFGYLEWGVWFDSMMASSGVFIIYIFLQITNPFASFLDSVVALGVAVIYFGFFTMCLIYTHRNKDKLYCIERDELVDGMELKAKLQANPTFKLRNIWHFIHRLEYEPKKSYFLFYFVIRKIYLAIMLLMFQSMPKIQLLMSSFSHLVVIIAVYKWDFFKEKTERRRMMISEGFVFLGLGFMYFLLDDQSEDEAFRFVYSWIVLSCLLMSLFIHAIFFFFQEIFAPIYYCIFRRKKQSTRVVDLRAMRKEGKLALPDVSNNASQINGNSGIFGKEEYIGSPSKQNSNQDLESEMLELRSTKNSMFNTPLNRDTQTSLLSKKQPAYKQAALRRQSTRFKTTTQNKFSVDELAHATEQKESDEALKDDVKRNTAYNSTGNSFRKQSTINQHFQPLDQSSSGDNTPNSTNYGVDRNPFNRRKTRSQFSKITEE